MRVARSGVSDAHKNGHLTLVPKLLQRTHSGVEAKFVVDGDDLVFGNRQCGTEIPVKAVVARDDHV